jgi:hypothetical protein
MGYGIGIPVIGIIVLIKRIVIYIIICVHQK